MMAFLRNLSFSSSHEQDTTEDEEDLMPKETHREQRRANRTFETPAIDSSVEFLSCVFLLLDSS